MGGLDAVDITVVASGVNIAGYLSVAVDDSAITLQASQFGNGRFPAYTTFVIYDPNSETRKGNHDASTCDGVVCVTLHSSCSKPIGYEDIFGPLRVDGFTNTAGDSELNCALLRSQDRQAIGIGVIDTPGQTQPTDAGPADSGETSNTKESRQDDSSSASTGLVSALGGVALLIGITSLIVLRYRRSMIPGDDVDTQTETSGKVRQNWDLSFSPAGNSGRLEGLAWDQPSDMFSPNSDQFVDESNEVVAFVKQPRQTNKVNWQLSQFESEASSELGDGSSQLNSASTLASGSEFTESSSINEEQGNNPARLQTMFMLRASEWQGRDETTADLDLDIDTYQDEADDVSEFTTTSLLERMRSRAEVSDDKYLDVTPGPTTML